MFIWDWFTGVLGYLGELNILFIEAHHTFAWNVRMLMLENSNLSLTVRLAASQPCRMNTQVFGC